MQPIEGDEPARGEHERSGAHGDHDPLAWPASGAYVVARHCSGDSTGEFVTLETQFGLYFGGDFCEPADIGDLGPAGLPHVEGINDHFAQRRDPGGDNIEVGVEEGPEASLSTWTSLPGT